MPSLATRDSSVGTLEVVGVSIVCTAAVLFSFFPAVAEGAEAMMPPMSLFHRLIKCNNFATVNKSSRSCKASGNRPQVWIISSSFS